MVPRMRNLVTYVEMWLNNKLLPLSFQASRVCVLRFKISVWDIAPISSSEVPQESFRTNDIISPKNCFFFPKNGIPMITMVG